MNIAERRRPQDGHISLKMGERELDVRVATADTVIGETMVLRLLDRSPELLSLPYLGLLPEPLELFRWMLRSTSGLILVAGPTGAGKTTTLYSALNEMDKNERKMVTIEDPVEYQLPGISSIQTNEKAGVTFPNALRSILRLDPDVIMVGEVRDSETARIAVQAALTGHQVLTTIHSSDAQQAIMRLLDLGVEPFLLGSALKGIVAQRMVRKTCEYCRVPDPSPVPLDPLITEELPEDTQFMVGVGCYLCSFTGYRGRTGIFEVVHMTDALRRAVLQGLDRNGLMELASREGAFTLREDAVLKACQGITTTSEVLRCAYAP